MPPPNPRDGETAFVPAWADRVETFFARALCHTKGRWARVPFKLEPWQASEIIRPLFGTARFDADLSEWVRLYNELWLELARKNGKSEIMAGIGLYLLCGDGEEGAEVYAAAKDKDQAALVYGVAARMVQLSPVLSRRLTVIDSKRRIVDPVSSSVLQVVAADADGNLGQNPHGVVFDEIIAQPSRDLYDTFRTSFGGRHQPLLVCATTAGNDPEAFAALEHSNAAATAEDPSRQPNRLVVIRNTPSRAAAGSGWVTRGPVDEDGLAEVDPFNETNWHHANPAIRSGFLNRAILRAEARAAQSEPEKENAFRQYRLNQWVQQATRAIPLDVWDASAGILDEADLVGRRAFGGLDLSATSDLASVAYVFPPLDPTADPTSVAGELPALSRYWVVAAAVPELDRHTGGRVSLWAREGFLTIVDGEVIDYDLIHAQIDRDRRRFQLVDVSVDPWNAAGSLAWFERERITGVTVAQTFRALSPPTKEFLRLVRSRQLRHGGHPVTRWNVDSLELKRDNAENVRPVKPERHKSGRRVDGVVALILAIDGWQRRGSGRHRSAYEDRGLEKA